MPEDSGPDFKRMGIFKELGYTTINDPYTVVRPDKLFRTLVNEPGMRPMVLAGGFSKTRAATEDGYFAPFARVFEGEAGTNIIQLRRAWRKENNAKKLGPDWVYSSPAKKRLGVGSPFGCFQETYPAMSREAKRVEKEPELHNFYTNPGKKGTGYGYLDVTINPYPPWMAGASTVASQHENIIKSIEEHKQLSLGRPVFVSQQHSNDDFNPEAYSGVNPLAPGGPVTHKFGNSAADKSLNIGPTFIPSSPAKWDGGCKDGCLSKFPTYVGDPYVDQYRLMMQRLKKTPEEQQLRPWVPQPPTAVEIPTPSVVNRNIDLAINAKTRKKRLHVMPFCKKK